MFECERKHIYGDLDYLKKMITYFGIVWLLLRIVQGDLMRLEYEPAEAYEKIAAYREAEGEMLKYILTISELKEMVSQSNSQF